MAVTVTCKAWPDDAASRGPAAVVLCEGDVGLHLGVLYRGAKSERVLHLAWHRTLLDEPMTEEGGWWVVPSAVDEEELKLLVGHCTNIGRKSAEATIPYGLRHQISTIDRKGTFRPGPGESGLTCATFALALFQLAGVTLLDLASWEARDATRRDEDEAAQRALVKALRKKYPEQAAAIEREMGCARFRSEEVAAANGLGEPPVAYARAAPEGAALRQRVAPPPRKKSRRSGK